MLTAKTPAESVGHLGEIELIQKISEWLGEASPPTPNGIGDDCAVLEPLKQHKQLITVDSISYGQHFNEKVAAKDAGAKLIKRNLSDIAAMGGTPSQAVLALLCGPNISALWLEDFFKGIRTICKEYKVQLVGGDVSSLPKGQFSATLTLLGNVRAPKLRHSSKKEDSIYVTGTLGGSLLGKHYSFEPRLAEGQWLADQLHCNAMIDLSDGLGKDLKKLLPEGSSAYLDLEAIPISEAAKKMAQTSGRLQSIEHAFCDGEDYELLFTLDIKADKLEFEKSWQHTFPQTLLTCIGYIDSASDKDLYIDAETHAALPWTYGFEHLKL